MHSYINSAYLLEDKDGMIWLGYDFGILVIDGEKNEIVKAYLRKEDENFQDSLDYPCYPILGKGGILSLAQHQSGQIWVGTSTNGVLVIDPESNSLLSQINVKSGLSNSTVPGIIPQGDQVWISTYNGLNQYDIVEDNMFNYSIKEGLPHNEFNRMSFKESKSGMIALGSMNGLTVFNPTIVQHQIARSELVLSEISYFGKDGNQINRIFDLDDVSITLPSEYRSCSFKVSLKGVDINKKLRYSYAIVPKEYLNDSASYKWVDNDNNRDISFDYLPSGRYELLIKAASSDIGKSDPLQISLNVKEYFYRTWWFLTGCICLLALVFYMLYRYRLQQALKTEQLKTQLSSNLHDDVGSVLSGVAYQMELLEYSVDQSQRPLVRQIATLSRRAMRQMRDVVWAIDSRNSKGVELVGRLREISEELLEPMQINFEISANLAFEQLNVSSDLLHDILLISKEAGRSSARS